MLISANRVAISGVRWSISNSRSPISKGAGAISNSRGTISKVQKPISRSRTAVSDAVGFLALAVEGDGEDALPDSFAGGTIR